MLDFIFAVVALVGAFKNRGRHGRRRRQPVLRRAADDHCPSRRCSSGRLRADHRQPEPSISTPQPKNQRDFIPACQPQKYIARGTLASSNSRIGSDFCRACDAPKNTSESDSGCWYRITWALAILSWPLEIVDRVLQVADLVGSACCRAPAGDVKMRPVASALTSSALSCSARPSRITSWKRSYASLRMPLPDNTFIVCHVAERTQRVFVRPGRQRLGLNAEVGGEL